MPKRQQTDLFELKVMKWAWPWASQQSSIDWRPHTEADCRSKSSTCITQPRNCWPMWQPRPLDANQAIKSSTYMLNSKGDKTLPWRTPHTIANSELKKPFQYTEAVSFLYQLTNTFIKQRGTFRSINLLNRILWLTRSKALLASRNEIYTRATTVVKMSDNL